MSFASRRVSIAAKLARELGGFLRTRPAKIEWPGGVVSFTFDDFPRSAWLNGGAILEQLGKHGTYYAAMGLAGADSNLGKMFAPEDLRAAHARGHEIACHTYSHRDCCHASPAEIVAEIARNAAALAEVIVDIPLDNFAYPFGGVSLTAKNTLGDRFASCRGTGRGINRGTVDLSDLLSSSIYSRDFDRDALCRLIDDARAANGWVIFYTHDVTEAPSPFGCTPEQFEPVVAYAAENAPVLPVRDVLAGLGFAKHRSAPAKHAA